MRQLKQSLKNHSNIQTVSFTQVDIMSYTPSVNDYNRWLQAKVWVTGNEKACRKEYIPSFTQSLTNWIKKRGYKMNGMFTAKAVAKWLYAIQIQEVARRNHWGPIYYPGPYHRDWEEDWDTFDMEVSQESCEEFLEHWRNNEDLQFDLPSGDRVRVELQKLLYTYIHLESSKHGMKIARLLAEASDNDDSEGENEIDSYLRDTQEGFHK